MRKKNIIVQVPFRTNRVRAKMISEGDYKDHIRLIVLIDEIRKIPNHQVILSNLYGTDKTLINYLIEEYYMEMHPPIY